MSKPRIWTLLTLFILLLTSISFSDGRAIPLTAWLKLQASGWQTVQNAAAGYSLEVPRAASVYFYERENVLHIVLPGEQVMLITLIAEPAAGAAFRKINFPTTAEQDTLLGGLPAVTFDIFGPVWNTRRIVAEHGSRTLQIDYPLGDAASQAAFERILASLSWENNETSTGYTTIPSGVENIADLDVPHYRQTDPPWRCDQLGSCWCYGGCGAYTSIADAGCYITSEAMIYSYYTDGDWTPQDVNDCRTQRGGYSVWAGCGYGLCAASYNPLETCKPANVSYRGMSGDLSVLDGDLEDGYPAIAWVDYSTHYVVVIGKSNGLYNIRDPLYARTQIYPGWITHFVRFRGEHEPTPTPRPTPTPFPIFTPDPRLNQRNYLPLLQK